LSGGECLDCPTGCTSCSSSNRCLTCEDNFNLLNGKCLISLPPVEKPSKLAFSRKLRNQHYVIIFLAIAYIVSYSIRITIYFTGKCSKKKYLKTIKRKEALRRSYVNSIIGAESSYVNSEEHSPVQQSYLMPTASTVPIQVAGSRKLNKVLPHQYALAIHIAKMKEKRKLNQIVPS